MYCNDYDLEEECNCQGPGMGCNICNPPSSEVQVERSNLILTNKHTLTYTFSKTEEVKVLKIKHIERTFPKVVLVLSKEREWFYIPIHLIKKAKKTSKGNWKITVPESFIKKVISTPNNHYFEKKEYES